MNVFIAALALALPPQAPAPPQAPPVAGSYVVAPAAVAAPLAAATHLPGSVVVLRDLGQPPLPVATVSGPVTYYQPPAYYPPQPTPAAYAGWPAAYPAPAYRPPEVMYYQPAQACPGGVCPPARWR